VSKDQHNQFVTVMTGFVKSTTTSHAETNKTMQAGFTEQSAAIVKTNKTMEAGFAEMEKKFHTLTDDYKTA
jgi:hypothetical protein